jgi:hypothetical protein
MKIIVYRLGKLIAKKGNNNTWLQRKQEALEWLFEPQVHVHIQLAG